MLFSCRVQITGTAFASAGCAGVQPGQNILALQSRHVVQPARSLKLGVWPMISQSFVPVSEYGVLQVRGIAFFLLRRWGIISPQRVCCMRSAFLDTSGSHVPQ